MACADAVRPRRRPEGRASPGSDPSRAGPGRGAVAAIALDADQVLAYRLARSGLAARDAQGLAEAAACPASDFARGAALLALAARIEEISEAGFRAAVDSGGVILAHAVRGAIHVVAPGDFPLYGRALIAADDDELAAQLGPQVRRLVAEHGIAPTGALAEVGDATRKALAGGRRLDKNALHEALRGQVDPRLMPWCRGCRSHHVAPMLWRYATVRAGARLDADRRYMSTRARRSPVASEAVRRFLGFYGPARPADFAGWAGLARSHARRLWDEVSAELAEVEVNGSRGSILEQDLVALESPPAAAGVRLIPPGDPYLQGPNRPLLAPDRALRSRLFRPVASPGVVLSDGRLAGTWRVRARGKAAEIVVEKIRRLRGDEVEEEAARIARLRGAAEAAVVIA